VVEVQTAKAYSPHHRLNLRDPRGRPALDGSALPAGGGQGWSVTAIRCPGGCRLGTDTKAAKSFTDAVNELLRQGWGVDGPLLAVTVQKPPQGHVLYQPLIKLRERG